jgi:hypothetical protein
MSGNVETLGWLEDRLGGECRPRPDTDEEILQLADDRLDCTFSDQVALSDFQSHYERFELHALVVDAID